jgi:hypothetical protein
MVQIDSPEILMEFVAGLILLNVTYNHDFVAFIGSFYCSCYILS